MSDIDKSLREISPKEFQNEVSDAIRLCFQNKISKNEMSDRLRLMVSKPLIADVLNGSEDIFFKMNHMAISMDAATSCNNVAQELIARAGVFSFKDKKSAKLWKLASVSLAEGVSEYNDFVDKFCE
jgi:hypothetical protein